MAEHRRAPAKREKTGRRKAKPADRAVDKVTAAGSLPLAVDPATMVADGNRPHETALHDNTLEDFGLDVLPVIQPHRA
jgi:hypothetical protein